MHITADYLTPAISFIAKTVASVIFHCLGAARANFLINVTYRVRQHGR